MWLLRPYQFPDYDFLEIKINFLIRSSPCKLVPASDLSLNLGAMLNVAKIDLWVTWSWRPYYFRFFIVVIIVSLQLLIVTSSQYRLTSLFVHPLHNFSFPLSILLWLIDWLIDLSLSLLWFCSAAIRTNLINSASSRHHHSSSSIWFFLTHVLWLASSASSQPKHVSALSTCFFCIQRANSISLPYELHRKYQRC